MTPLRLILVDPDPRLVVEWRERFDGLPAVEVVEGCFEELPEYDCMVTAGNSFGIMDGGIDLAVTRYFGVPLMRRVQSRILAGFLGEQPVGTSIVVETQHPKHPYLAHTPTMRVPMSIARTDYVYCAMWATLLAIHHHNLSGRPMIETVACPGLGTGVGMMHAREVARQMALAYKHYLKPPQQIHWPYADLRQKAVRWGGDLGYPPRPVAENNHI